jgi:pilus assembly protein Flp/PilA
MKYWSIFNYHYSGNTLLTTQSNAANTMQFAFDINFGARGRRYGVAHGSERQMKTAVGAKLRQPRVDQGVTIMKYLVARFVKDESGATAIEYGLIAAGISVAIIAVVQGLGSKLNTTFTSVQTALK